MIIRHATACNFLLDSFLFCEVGLDVLICVALQWLLVPTRARHAQAMLERVAPQLQIGSGTMLKVIPREQQPATTRPAIIENIICFTLRLLRFTPAPSDAGVTSS